jgi:hypothetical protein
LSAGAPEVSGKDIVVVEPTTAGVSVPGNDVDLDVAALGSFSAVNNSCTLGGNPVMLTRPQSGVATASLCRNSTSDPGWPSLQGCVVPPVDISFTVRIRPGP